MIVVIVFFIINTVINRDDYNYALDYIESNPVEFESFTDQDRKIKVIIEHPKNWEQDNNEIFRPYNNKGMKTSLRFFLGNKESSEFVSDNLDSITKSDSQFINGKKVFRREYPFFSHLGDGTGGITSYNIELYSPREEPFNEVFSIFCNGNIKDKKTIQEICRRAISSLKYEEV